MFSDFLPQDSFEARYLEFFETLNNLSFDSPSYQTLISLLAIKIKGQVDRYIAQCQIAHESGGKEPKPKPLNTKLLAQQIKEAVGRFYTEYEQELKSYYGSQSIELEILAEELENCADKLGTALAKLPKVKEKSNTPTQFIAKLTKSIFQFFNRRSIEVLEQKRKDLVKKQSKINVPGYQPRAEEKKTIKEIRRIEKKITKMEEKITAEKRRSFRATASTLMKQATTSSLREANNVFAAIIKGSLAEFRFGQLLRLIDGPHDRYSDKVESITNKFTSGAVDSKEMMRNIEKTFSEFYQSFLKEVKKGTIPMSLSEYASLKASLLMQCDELLGTIRETKQSKELIETFLDASEKFLDGMDAALVKKEAKETYVGFSKPGPGKKPKNDKSNPTPSDHPAVH